jgi:hypothetical protein
LLLGGVGKRGGAAATCLFYLHISTYPVLLLHYTLLDIRFFITFVSSLLIVGVATVSLAQAKKKREKKGRFFLQITASRSPPLSLPSCTFLLFFDTVSYLLLSGLLLGLLPLVPFTPYVRSFTLPTLFSLLLLKLSAKLFFLFFFFFNTRCPVEMKESARGRGKAKKKKTLFHQDFHASFQSTLTSAQDLVLVRVCTRLCIC